MTINSIIDQNHNKVNKNLENIFDISHNPFFVKKYPDCAAICGNGQPRLATLLLLDFLKENHSFYYHGDFDPEGLLIAQKLKVRYGERLKLWKYEADLYETYLSEVELSDRRMKKLEQVSVQELQEIREAMYKKRRSAYQESMMEALRK